MFRRSKIRSRFCHLVPGVGEMRIYFLQIPVVSFVLGACVPTLPCVTLGCPAKSTAEVGLSDIIEPQQSHLLNASAEQNIFTSAESN